MNHNKQNCKSCSKHTWKGRVDASDEQFYCEDCWTDFGVPLPEFSCASCSQLKPCYEFSKSQLGKSKALRKCKRCLYVPPKQQKKLVLPDDPVLPMDREQIYFHHIHETIYVGSLESTLCRDELVEAGVTNILSIGPAPLHHYDIFCYLHFDLEDLEHENIYPFFPDAFEFIDSSKGGILIHCQQGVSRSATIAIAWIMRQQQCSFFETLEYAQAKRKVVNPNLGFRMQLRAFQLSSYEYSKKLEDFWNRLYLKNAFQVAFNDHNIILMRLEEAESNLNRSEKKARKELWSKSAADAERFSRIKVPEESLREKKQLVQRYRKLRRTLR